MELSKILSMVDHTLLKPESTWAQIQEICDDAIKYQTATVCIPASYVARCKAYMTQKGSDVGVCTVIGFPTGYSTTAAKVFEAADAVKNGADEIDMVINVGNVKDGKYDEVLEEIPDIPEEITEETTEEIIEDSVEETPVQEAESLEEVISEENTVTDQQAPFVIGGGEDE